MRIGVIYYRVAVDGQIRALGAIRGSSVWGIRLGGGRRGDRKGRILTAESAETTEVGGIGFRALRASEGEVAPI